jgi:hypothetical protein
MFRHEEADRALLGRELSEVLGTSELESEIAERE